MSKVIATRIKNVLPNIIHHNQTDYLKDRYIGVMDSTLKETQEVRVALGYRLVRLLRFSRA